MSLIVMLFLLAASELVASAGTSDESRGQSTEVFPHWLGLCGRRGMHRLVAVRSFLVGRSAVVWMQRFSRNRRDGAIPRSAKQHCCRVLHTMSR